LRHGPGRLAGVPGGAGRPRLERRAQPPDRVPGPRGRRGRAGPPGGGAGRGPGGGDPRGEHLRRPRGEAGHLDHPDPRRAEPGGGVGRPGGNLTGLVTIPTESLGKHVDLLKEAVPGLARLAYFAEATPGSPAVAERAAAIGRSLQIVVHPFAVSRPGELDAAFRAALERRVGAGAVLATPVLVARRARVV